MRRIAMLFVFIVSLPLTPLASEGQETTGSKPATSTSIATPAGPITIENNIDLSGLAALVAGTKGSMAPSAELEALRLEIRALQLRQQSAPQDAAVLAWQDEMLRLQRREVELSEHIQRSVRNNNGWNMAQTAVGLVHLGVDWDTNKKFGRITRLFEDNNLLANARPNQNITLSSANDIKGVSSSKSDADADAKSGSSSSSKGGNATGGNGGNATGGGGGAGGGGCQNCGGGGNTGDNNNDNDNKNDNDNDNENDNDNDNDNKNGGDKGRTRDDDTGKGHDDKTTNAKSGVSGVKLHNPRHPGHYPGDN